MQIKESKEKKKVSPNSPGSIEKMQAKREQSEILKHDGKVEDIENRIDDNGPEDLDRYPENPYEEIEETEESEETGDSNKAKEKY
jgi:hypothetical protein